MRENPVFSWVLKKIVVVDDHINPHQGQKAVGYIIHCSPDFTQTIDKMLTHRL